MEELADCYNIEKLGTHRRKKLLKIMYKESEIETYINSLRPQMELRSKTKAKMNHGFTVISKVYESPLYRGLSSRLWNSVPMGLHNEKDYIKFKAEITKLII